MIKFKLAHREIGKNVVAVRVAATVMFRKLRLLFLKYRP